MQNMQNSKIYANIAAILTLLFAFSCGIFQPQDRSAYLLLQVRETEQEALAKTMTSIDSLQCMVQRSNKIVYNESLTPENGRFQNDIKLEPGNGYSVSLLGRHQSVTVGQAYTDSIDLNKGETRTVVLTWNAFTVKLLQPGADSLLFQNKPALAWQNCPGAVSYDLQIDDQQDFSAPEISESALTAAELTLETPLSDATWHWRVRPRDEQDTPGHWSDVRTFRINTGAPDAPVLIAPADQSVLSALPKLQWKDQPDIQAWHVRVDDQPGFSSPEAQDLTLTESMFFPDSLSDRLYYWQVRARYTGPWGGWSDIWRFTLDTRGPEAPSLTQPADGSVLDTDTPTLSWQQVSEAQTYEVVIDTSSAFTAPVARDTALNETLYTPSSLDDASYVWRVRARDAQGHWGAWSETWSFVVDARVPEAPQLRKPQNDIVITDSLPIFTWGPVDAVYYQIRIDDDTDFGTPVIAESGFEQPAYTTSTALSDNQYYWSVRGRDAHGNWGNWSDIWSFSIDTKGPDAPQPVAPANDMELSNSTPTLRWSAVSDAEYYHLQVYDDIGIINPEIDIDNLSDSEYTISQSLDDNKYFWRVRGKDAYGNFGKWSKVWQFEIETTTTGTVIDIDGNTYKTVKIGDQWWMAENLRVTHYRNGDDIPNVTIDIEWSNLSSGAYCAYNNNENNVGNYGYLYNWFALYDSQNIAPEGWHVPTDEEWKQLEMTLGMSRVDADDYQGRGTSEGKKLKEGVFNALLAGYRLYDGEFRKMKENALFWTSTEDNNEKAWDRELYDNGYTNVWRMDKDKNNGKSVRCVKGEVGTQANIPPNASFSISPTSGTTETPFTFDASGCSDNDDVVSALQVRWDWENDGTWDTGYSTTKTATHTFSSPGSKTVNLQVMDTGGLTHSTTRQISVTDSVSETSTVIDIDGNTYQTVKIGDQWWMAENLRVTHYRNGDAIANVTIDSEWQALSSGAYCAYDNLESNADVYGYLYNWYAVDDTRNIAPEGWHVPTDEVWKELEMALGMSESNAYNTGFRGTNEGSKLAGNALLWRDGELDNDPLFGISGFSALPGGFRAGTGPFHNIGNYTFFWTLTEYDTDNAFYREIYYSNSFISLTSTDKHYGYSLRCVQD
ncbi:MAG: FISUMP domain-containing protein [candidate division KSB1 bacterium]|nr:FISUMP domain-containing protein [candidate division KSB1 bacterium]